MDELPVVAERRKHFGTNEKKYHACVKKENAMLQTALRISI